ncbi:MAG: PAS domain S-box protein, partial [Proteobacteria bacterium]|nr:PAS domain S-box protein [Pseudomonadota bacterium]
MAASVEELVHVWSLTGEVRWINGSFERVLQLGIAELASSRADRVVADDLPGVHAALTAFLASPATRSGSIVCRCHDASHHAVTLASVVHRVTWQDEPALLVVSRPTIASSVDDRRLRLMVENFNDILLIMDKEGVERFVSPACERILGFRADELIGHFGLEFVHPDDQAAIRAGLVATVR